MQALRVHLTSKDAYNNVLTEKRESLIVPQSDPHTDTQFGDNTVVKLVNVSRSFKSTDALKNVSLDVKKSEIIGIIGRSGAGKSTLIRCINGLEKFNSGIIEVEGRSIAGLTEVELQTVRRRVGMVFQHFNLLSAKTVAQNIALPLKIAGYSSAERKRKVLELLDLVGLSDKANHYPASLSGGQKQRVGIARALSTNPALLLCDEATSALDPETTRSILALLKSLNQRLGITILLITHEMEVIKSIAHRVAVLNKGEIVEQGKVWQVFANPQTNITRALLKGLQPQLPDNLASRITQQPPTKGVTIFSAHAVGDDKRQGELITDMAVALTDQFRLLHGGIDHIQGYPVIRFFFSIDCSDKVAERVVLDWINNRQVSVERLGYVPSID